MVTNAILSVSSLSATETGSAPNVVSGLSRRKLD
jgi:hypothetical protein